MQYAYAYAYYKRIQNITQVLVLFDTRRVCHSQFTMYTDFLLQIHVRIRILFMHIHAYSRSHAIRYAH